MNSLLLFVNEREKTCDTLLANYVADSHKGVPSAFAQRTEARLETRIPGLDVFLPSSTHAYTRV